MSNTFLLPTGETILAHPESPLGFKRNKPPVDTTLSRILAKTTLQELQNALAEFLNILLSEEYGDGQVVEQALLLRRLAPREHTKMFHYHDNSQNA